MKQADIKVGEYYTAKVSNKITTVKVDRVEKNYQGSTRYHVTNIETGRKTTFRSAAKFRSVAPRPTKSVEAEVTGVESSNVGNRVGLVIRDGGKLKGMTPVVATTKPSGQKKSPLPVTNPVEEAEVTKAREEAYAKPSLVEQGVIGKVLRKSNDQSPHVVVQALAGCGKTTTLIEGLKLLFGEESKLTPSPQQKSIWDAILESKGKATSVCFVAFNKSIATELQNRVPKGCDAMTMHSMGYKAVQKAFGRVQVSSYRVQDIISEILEKDIRELRQHKFEMIKAVEKLVDLCKVNLVTDLSSESLGDIASYYEIELNSSFNEIFSLVPQVLERCKDVAKDKRIDFADMIWLPIILDLPLTKYDLLLVDERQDLSKCQQQLAFRSGSRIIAVGDEFQSIYAFAGADADACKSMEEMLADTPRGLVKLPLTVTRRCGKAIVEEARTIVKDFEAHPTNGDGKISQSNYKGEKTTYRDLVSDGDLILCRMNAPLVSECFKFIRAGKKANIRGRDVGQGLISTIKKLAAGNVADLSGKLSDWYFAETQKENAKRNPNDNKLINLQDRYECLVCFIEGQSTIEGVIQKIETIFTDDKDSRGVLLSSIHRAKGTEADRVFLLQPKGAQVMHPRTKTEWGKRSNLNLLYVAITRSIKELTHVS